MILLGAVSHIPEKSEPAFLGTLKILKIRCVRPLMLKIAVRVNLTPHATVPVVRRT